jgi:O-antigen biosynthesis protein
LSKYDYFNTNSCSVHQKIIHFIGQDKKVLDVGCSEGILSKKMNENNCQVVGIELDFEAAKIAECSCQELIIGDVELIQLNPKYENYFDVIIFADILEHLRDPLDVLERFKKYLNDDGYIIISLPNFVNWRIRLQMLFGNFKYDEFGILDIGHLRFFTEKSAKRMVKDAGLKITKFDLTVGDLKTFPKIFHTIGMIWPNLMAFQFLIIAKKDK